MSRPAPDPAAECQATRMQQDSGTDLDPLTAQENSPADPRAPSPSTAQLCHTDALHCIFAFLALKDLPRVLHSCRDWYAAGCKEPPRALVLRMTTIPVTLPATSPLRHHIADLTIHWGLYMRLDQLRLLRRLPRLTALDASLTEADVDAQMRSAGLSAESLEQQAQLWRDALPTQLCSLKLNMLSAWRTSHSIRQSLLAALPTLPQLATLRLDIDTADLDLSPLLDLPQLRDLHLQKDPSISQCAVLKQLSSLTALRLGCATVQRDTLLELLSPPHRLQQLQRVPGLRSVDPPLLTALQQLPGLTELDPTHVEPDCWAGLIELAQLRTLRLDWSDSFTGAQQSSLVFSLNALPHLFNLTLSLPGHAQSAHTPLTLRLLALRRLLLGRLAVPSLAFLQHSPLLEELTLSRCEGMDAADVMDCLQFYVPRLHRLIMDRSVRLDEDQQAQLCPPSALLPALAHLRYVAAK